MEKEEKITITLYTESLFQSIVADIGTFVMLTGMFWVNAHYIQSRFFMAVIMVMLALKIVAIATGRKTVYTSRAEAIKALTP